MCILSKHNLFPAEKIKADTIENYKSGENPKL